MPRSFILCADDLGLSPAVSAGIIEAAARRRISAASAMVNLPSWPAAAQGWRQASPTAGLGLHLNLTVGAPLSALRDQLGGAGFPAIGFWLRGMGASKTMIQALQLEIEAQLDAFQAATGTMPRHIDGHQHVHVLPPVSAALLSVLQRRALAPSLWLRNSADTTRRILQRGGQTAKALSVKVLARGFGGRLRKAGITSNDGFAGFSGFDAASDYAEAFKSYLVAPGPRHLVMCHPGYVDDELHARDGVTATRPRELEFLLSNRFEDCLGERDARLAEAF